MDLDSVRAEMLKAIVERRKAQGLTQADVADQLGMDSGYISRIERGVHDVRLRTLLRLLEVLGLRMILVTEDWLQAYQRQLAEHDHDLVERAQDVNTSLARLALLQTRELDKTLRLIAQDNNNNGE